MKISHTLSGLQCLSLTPQMRQALRILQLSTAELTELISSTLEENPLLEYEEPRDSEDFTQTEAQSESFWEHVPSSEEPAWEAKEAAVTLAEHLERQAGFLPLSEQDQRILLWLIGSLDEEGLLRSSLEKIRLEAPFGQKTDPAEWQVALKLLQSFDPPGIGASSLEESLAIQLFYLEEENIIRPEIRAIADKIVCSHMDLAARRKFERLRSLLECTAEDLTEALKVISSLNPHPASDFSTERIDYIIPEIRVTRAGTRWRASLIEHSYPKVRINRPYADAVASCSEKDLQASWKEKILEARSLMKSIAQREKTLLRVASSLVRHQSAFFDKGPSALRLLGIKDVAEELGVHPSTVSRVCSGKYLLAPSGIFELKYFFCSGTKSSEKEGADTISSAAVKHLIEQIIASEDAKAPYSDGKISELLKEKGVRAARRTVAKYRENLGIAPAPQRKKNPAAPSEL